MALIFHFNKTKSAIRLKQIEGIAPDLEVFKIEDDNYFSLINLYQAAHGSNESKISEYRIKSLSFYAKKLSSPYGCELYQLGGENGYLIVNPNENAVIYSISLNHLFNDILKRWSDLFFKFVDANTLREELPNLFNNKLNALNDVLLTTPFNEKLEKESLVSLVPWEFNEFDYAPEVFAKHTFLAAEFEEDENMYWQEFSGNMIGVGKFSLLVVKEIDPSDTYPYDLNLDDNGILYLTDLVCDDAASNLALIMPYFNAKQIVEEIVEYTKTPNKIVCGLTTSGHWIQMLLCLNSDEETVYVEKMAVTPFYAKPTKLIV